MVSSALKPAVSRVIEPIARVAARVGVTPNAVTLLGTAATTASALFFFPQGKLFLGTLVISLLALSDLFDGAIARASARGPSAWGGFLDSTCDRITDAAILGSLAAYCVIEENRLAPVAIAALVLGFLVPYIRAKSESFGIDCSVGLAERTERLIISLVAIGLHGVGAPYALAIGLWSLVLLTGITVGQRIIVVRRGLSSI
jgi:CDP-diacylglycerol--glycerol-3-phosphate 3-phosphatidyltransferase